MLRTYRVLVAFLTLAALCTPAMAETPPAAIKAMSKGQNLLHEGKYKPALRQLQKAEKLTPEPPIALLLDLAACSSGLGEHYDAEAYARRALEVITDPNHKVRALNYVGISLFAQTKAKFLGSNGIASEKLWSSLTEAESAFREILELTGGKASVVWYNLGEVLKLRSREQQANTAFLEYLKRSPDGPHAAAARRAMEWIACVQAFEKPESDEANSSSALARIGGDVRPPVKVHTPSPWYTERARREGVQGTVLLETIIDTQGDVQCIDVIHGLPMGLTESVLKAVRDWKFEPATLHGEPVVLRYNLSIKLSL